MSDNVFPTREQILLPGDDLKVTSNGVTSPQLRKRLRAYYEAFEREEEAYDLEWEAYLASGRQIKEPIDAHTDFPEECMDMVCGAIRKGIPCKQRAIFPNGQ